ncbi:MAG: GNAT family N-acetyltransferase [Bacteroidales bacterium]|nr:GNAT family N-acetyltransferase [Bacteroidales bacterium]
MNTSNIEIKETSNGDIEICRELCGELMQFQASQSKFGTKVLESMTFDNRLKPSFEKAQLKKLLVAFDGNKAIGYVYVEAADLTEEVRYYVPDWAKTIYRNGHLVFFPPEQKFPAKLGTFNNLYIKPQYHGIGLGDKLSQHVMDWLTGIDKIGGIYVYVSNGNEKVADFYKKYGFLYSHEVLGGFIKAYYKGV